MNAAPSLAWFARHELRLGWRDLVSLMTAGRRRKPFAIIVASVLFLLVAHLVAYGMIAKFAAIGVEPDRSALTVITGILFLVFAMMVSQSIESVTRAFYTRDDLELILTSPAPVHLTFILRIVTVATISFCMTLVVAAPVINALAISGGPRWLAAYGAMASLSLLATSVSVAMTFALFRVFGPGRTRLAAQILAAVIGAVFVIGIQIAAIIGYGQFSRLAFLQSKVVLDHAPARDSQLWIPARAVTGDLSNLAVFAVLALAVLSIVIIAFSRKFHGHVLDIANVSSQAGRKVSGNVFVNQRSPAGALRQKEWQLLKRDPWLMSQSLMQVIYLVPAAVFLWQSFDAASGSVSIIVPVLVMAAGQLAGGLAWLAVSGEDAPDIIATAPLTNGAILRAKIEAILSCVGIVFLPLLIIFAVFSPWSAGISSVFILIAASSATAIQLWFRAQAKRSHFRRRQTSSRIATFAEAFSSITWAAAAGLAAYGTPLFIIVAVIAIGILAGTWALSPKRD